MFLARDVEWRNKIVSTFREAGFPEGEQQWGLLAMTPRRSGSHVDRMRMVGQYRQAATNRGLTES